MSRRLVVVAVLLTVGVGLCWCQEAALADDSGSLTGPYYDQQYGDQPRDKRQVMFSEKEEMRRNCLRKSHQACCSLLKRDAVKFATCVKGYSWSNKDKTKPGCPGYPRCPGYKRG